MATEAKIGYGTTLTWETNPIAELTRIGPVKLAVAKVDATTLGSPDYYREFVPGLLDPGDVEIEGLFRPDDTDGQVALKTSMEARTSGAFIVAFPTALSTTTWTGNAYITAFEAGDAAPEGMIPFRATMSIIGKPTLGVTASAGMTALLAQETDASNIPYSPTVGAAVYTYLGDTLVDTTTCVSVKLTVTSTDTVITATCLGIEHVLTTEALSEAIAIGAAGTITPIYIRCKTTAKSPKDYVLWVNRA